MGNHSTGPQTFEDREYPNHRVEKSTTDEQIPCEHCCGEGVIETDNNGPIGDCPVCYGTGRRNVLND